MLKRVLTIIVILGILLVVACNPKPTGTITLRLGYFPNITHSQPIVGLAKGIFREDLGLNVNLVTITFNAGPSEIEALFANQIDAGYIGPSPAVNGYVKSQGKALKVVAGATSGGALFVTKPNIQKVSDLKGKVLSSPQLGNTQDVALRNFLLNNGLVPDKDVIIKPAANSDILNLFKRGDIDGAWVPEPWGTRMLLEGNGKLFLDERTLWPDGLFSTAVLIANTDFMSKHPEVVEALIKASVDTTMWINGNPQESIKIVASEISAITGVNMSEDLVGGAWGNMDATYDPIVSSIQSSADAAFKLGFLGDTKPDLSGLCSLDLLNKVLRGEGLPEVK
jgi:NitT/TauT family transport system substrate-binding protein